MKNPSWVRDEIILAMDLYLSAGRKQLPPSHRDVIELSNLLNRLPVHSVSMRGKNFRNATGVSMILGNFLAIDPQRDGRGLSRANRLQAVVWRDFESNPVALRQIAEAIRNGVSLSSDCWDVDLSGEFDVFPEGRLLTKLHVLRERSRSAVAAKIKHVLRTEKHLACEACRFDFHAFYGEIGRGFAECHHVLPLSDSVLQRGTRIRDLVIVCANCHRMLHRSRPVLTVSQLRSFIPQPWATLRGANA